MKKISFRTIDDVALKNKGNTTGFDYLRIGLALGVVLQHCAAKSNLTSNEWILDNRHAWTFILPAFFALSGYLVSGSIFRNSLPQFAVLRIVRIVPALAVEVFLSATLLGIVFTELPVMDYLTHGEFFAYFLNIIGDIHYKLPGVFDGGFVNAQLWTIPYELRCYILLGGTALVTLNVRAFKPYFPIVLLMMTTIFTTLSTIQYDEPSVSRQSSGRALEIGFLWACSLYMFKDKVPYSLALAITCAIAGVFLLEVRGMLFLATIPITYATVFLGIQKFPRIPFGDLSYGVFLFHYPILQMLNVEFGMTNTLAVMVATLFLSILFALASWNFIEKPILDRKTGILNWVAALETGFSQIFSRRRAAREPAVVVHDRKTP